MQEVGISVRRRTGAVDGVYAAHERIGHESSVGVQVALLVVQHLLPSRADGENGGNRTEQHGQNRREDEYAYFLCHDFSAIESTLTYTR